jgi:predicted  nucleic acid-binding Zn-ribbon protein
VHKSARAAAADEIGALKKEIDTLKKGQRSIEKELQEITGNCLNTNDPNRAKAAARASVTAEFANEVDDVNQSTANESCDSYRNSFDAEARCERDNENEG